MRVESRLSWLAVDAGSALCASVAVAGADARWLDALGAVIARAGHIPSSIPYAAAPSHDWVNVPVLGELVFHLLWAIGGEHALVVAQAAAVAATLPLFALLVLLLRSDARAPSRRIWLLVPLVALWSNLHGGVLAGLFVATLY